MAIVRDSYKLKLPINLNKHLSLSLKTVLTNYKVLKPTLKFVFKCQDELPYYHLKISNPSNPYKLWTLDQVLNYIMESLFKVKAVILSRDGQDIHQDR